MIFDWIFYINRYPELYNQGINTKEKAIKHWINYGIKEGRRINKNQININLEKLSGGDRYTTDELYNKLMNNKIEHITNTNINSNINSKIHFKIVTTKFIESIAQNLQNILKKFNIISDIIYELSDEDENNDNFYIIISYKFNKTFLPKKYILYVVEQTESRFFKDNKYLNMIKNANYIWDLCVKNRKLFMEYPFTNYYYLQCPFIKDKSYVVSNKYDILFYGTINNRRKTILDKLNNKYNIYIVNNIIGADRDELIKQSKIILNLHYYFEAGLETCRLNETLKFNKLVISELPFDDFYNTELYKNSIIFIDNINDDLSNINNLYNTIDKYLQNDFEYNKKINEIIINNDILQNKSEFNIQKLLLPLYNSTNVYYNYDLIPNKIYCLHLVETPERIKAFNNQKYKPDVEIFPAIKYNPGWVGCALSYVNLIYNAKRCNLDKITICEDDCRFKNDSKTSFDILYNNINYALDIIKKWDMFVGCVADLPDDTNISNVYKYKDMTFIEINKMHSNVFNIYNKSCYDTIINWDFNDKSRYNQIDQYLKKQNLKIIITYPFYFDCLDITSTIWDKNLYETYNTMFQNSLNTIKNKLDKWNKPIITIG
jgi:hypothetical protein